MFLPTSSSTSCIVSRARLKSAFELGATFVDLMFGFSMRFNALRMTQEETALFCALMLISPGTSLHLIYVFLSLVGWNDTFNHFVFSSYFAACTQQPVLS